MTPHLRFRLHGLLLTIGLLIGCAHERPNTRVVVPAATINGQSLHMLVDTGASTTILLSSSAEKLGLKLSSPFPKGSAPAGAVAVALSEPAVLSVGGQSITAPIPEIHISGFTSWFLELDFDGLIGWPEIRDNILLFDFDRRTIRALDQLPPETSTWLKLKLHKGDLLIFEVPLRDGTIGNILMDTGSPFGAALAPSRWKAWRDGHPDAPSHRENFFMPAAGTIRAEEAWAERIRIGDLEVTDLPVIAGSPRTFAGIDRCVAMFGMYMLSRFDLIVDGKNGYAYLHPKPAPGEYYAGFDRPGVTKQDSTGQLTAGDWTLADNVRLQDGNLRTLAALSAADDKVGSGDYAGAIDIYTGICDRDAERFEAFLGRAIARQCANELPGALHDYDRALELQTNSAEAIGAYPRIYRQLILMRMGTPEADFGANVAYWRRPWPRSMGQFLAGDIDEAALRAAAEKQGGGSAAVRRCEADYLIGVMRQLKGDLPGAKESWTKCVGSKLTDSTEYRLARADLDRLQAK